MPLWIGSLWALLVGFVVLMANNSWITKYSASVR
jgi:hypothetical protein